MSERAWIALLWLDWHLFLNRLRTIRRNPRRLIPWAVFLVWLIPSWINRIVIGGHLRPLPGHLVAQYLDPIGHVLPGVALLLLGLVVMRSDHAPAAFQSPADARFVVGAGVGPRVVFVWLALRTARRLILTAVVLVLMAQALYLPWLGVNGAGALTITLVIAGYGWIVFATGILAFNARRAARWIPMTAIGMLLTVAGGASVLAVVGDLLGLYRIPIPTLNLGDPVALTAMFALAIGLTVAGVMLAGDCYPELWASSNRIFAVRAALKARGGMFNVFGLRERKPGKHLSPVHSSSGSFVPAGSWTVLWKEWLAMRRGRGGGRLQVLMLIGAVALGIVVGLASGRGSVAAEVLSTNIVLVFVLWSWVAGMQLGRDLGSPLWWLSSAPLWRRLTTYTLARALRFALPLIVFLEAAIVASGQNLWLLPLAPWAPVLLCWLMQAVGLGGYAVLPARTDYRLALMLRMLLVYAITLPLVLAWIPGAVLHSEVLMAGLPALIALGAGGGLIAFATWRISGNGLAFAREERH